MAEPKEEIPPWMKAMSDYLLSESDTDADRHRVAFRAAFKEANPSLLKVTVVLLSLLRIVTTAVRQQRKAIVELRKDLSAREWKGVWSDATKYEKHNTVTWDGGSWYAARDSIGRRPGQSDDWRLIVQRGKQGKRGDAA